MVVCVMGRCRERCGRCNSAVHTKAKQGANAAGEEREEREQGIVSWCLLTERYQESHGNCGC